MVIYTSEKVNDTSTRCFFSKVVVKEFSLEREIEMGDRNGRLTIGRGKAFRIE